jgi:Flp pilus assembly pilin Flp
MRIKSKKGQGILEYAMILSIVVAVIVAIQLYVKRALEGKFKQSADQIGEQFTTAETYTIETQSQSARKEQTLAGLTPGTQGWTRSEIQGAGAFSTPVGAKVTYTGNEISKTDYVVQNIGGNVAGAHGTFASGKIGDKKLFEDD